MESVGCGAIGDAKAATLCEQEVAATWEGALRLVGIGGRGVQPPYEFALAEDGGRLLPFAYLAKSPTLAAAVSRERNLGSVGGILLVC